MKDPKWIKVYGFKNAELLMKCTYMEQYIPSSPSTLLPNTIGSEDLLRQSLSFDNPGLFTFQFSLDEYQDILELCQLFGHSSDQKYILRWQLFGQHFHSDEFGPSFLDMSPKPIQDIFQVQCPKDTIISKLIEQFPISLELLMIRPNHTIEENDLSNVLALASISFSVEDILRQAEATKSEVSVGMASVWFGLHPVDPSLTSPQLFAGSLQETVDSKPPEARIKVGFHLKTFKDESKSQPRTVSAAFRQDYYGNFNQNQLEIPSNVSEQMNAQSQTYPITSIINNNNNNKNNLYDTIRPIGATSQVNTDNDTLHHFRVSIDVKSVNQLKKPANIVVSYTYPHLGATSLVRTTPVWLQPQSEGRVENGCAVFDCCMTRRELLTVFSTYPLKISISNKTQAMSTALLGEVVIDLSYMQSTDPVSYRCLLTSHTFKSLQEYNDHRDMMIALRTAGHVDKIPPVDPVLIRATDCLYDIEVSASQVGIANDAKLRVITIVEDLGKVGPEVGLNVRQGYKQQGAGVYHDQDDAGPAHLTANERLNPLYKSAEILDLKSVNKDTMTATEQARWDILKQDWETWQKQAEIKWRESMREKEMQLREKLESEASQKLVVQVADLKRAHEAAARLEIRLRESISKIDQQKTQLLRKEEQMTTTLAQKTAELQLLQKTIRDEAKVKIDAETRRADALDKHIQTLKAQVLQLNKRCQETEQDFEAHRKRQRETPETMLREDNSRLRAQLAECKAEADRERRIQSELKLEKEQIRSQLHRMAIALKREKERNSALARQDLEQLRLEFLAREERYKISQPNIYKNISYLYVII